MLYNSDIRFRVFEEPILQASDHVWSHLLAPGDVLVGLEDGFLGSSGLVEDHGSRDPFSGRVIMASVKSAQRSVGRYVPEGATETIQ